MVLCRPNDVVEVDMSIADMIAEIESRNKLRREAGLPPLSVAEEVRRLKTWERRTEFEEFFEAERARNKHLWSEPLGWFGGFARWTKLRAQIRADFDAKKLRGEL